MRYQFSILRGKGLYSCRSSSKILTNYTFCVNTMHAKTENYFLSFTQISFTLHFDWRSECCTTRKAQKVEAKADMLCSPSLLYVFLSW